MAWRETIEERTMIHLNGRIDKSQEIKKY